MQDPPKSKDHEWTIIKLLEWTRSYFQSNCIESPRQAAEILLAYTLGVNRIDLYVQHDKPLCKNELGKFKTLIKRRIANEPVAYILETKEFWSMDFHVNQDVLIPRPETECLVEAALELLPDNAGTGQKNVLELGTGSGAVIISIASERPDNFFFASDRSIKAITIAKKNAVHLTLEHRINFFSGDWLLPVNEHLRFFDIIVSNPPYISKRVIPSLCPEIYRYEPIIALDGGEDGLSSLKNIIMGAHKYLKKHGYLLLEIGETQTSDLKKIIDDCGKYDQVTFIKDYSGYDRILKIRGSSSD
jgi:release factor glutamine methyltransferase